MFIRTWILLWYMLYTVIQYKPIIYIYILGSNVTGVVGRLSKMRLSQVIHFFSSVFSPVSQVKQKLHHIYIIHYIIYIYVSRGPQEVPDWQTNLYAKLRHSPSWHPMGPGMQRRPGANSDGRWLDGGCFGASYTVKWPWLLVKSLVMNLWDYRFQKMGWLSTYNW